MALGLFSLSAYSRWATQGELCLFRERDILLNTCLVLAKRVLLLGAEPFKVEQGVHRIARYSASRHLAWGAPSLTASSRRSCIHARSLDTREVVYKLAVEHDDQAAFKPFLREFDGPTTSMSVGTTGWFGARAEVKPVMRVFSTIIARETVPVTISFSDRQEELVEPQPPARFDPEQILRPACGETADLFADGEMEEVPLIELAWARSGDKGDAFNIGVIARKPEYLPWLRAGLEPSALLDWFDHAFEGSAVPAVHRFEVPGLDGINLHFLNSLGGGQFASLRLDPLAKGKAQQLLDLPVRIPVGFR